MGLYSRYILPHLIDAACGSRPIAKQRAKLVPKAAGAVLEIGFGSGRNLAHYDRSKVTQFAAVEPEAGIRALGRKALDAAGWRADLRADPAEALSFPAAQFDTVVCTFTLCTVHNPIAALKEAGRVLKPGGLLLFCEHGLAPDADVQRTQRRFEPLWTRLAGGCRLTRDPMALLAEAGFSPLESQSMYLPGTPRFGGFNVWGAAVPA
jgi:ubiquinone/menaquinone biosynthesis C-methylase UbiE